MPYFVECLRDVYKCCRTILLIFKSFVYPLYDSMCLIYCGESLPEVELMIVIFNHSEELFLRVGFQKL
jgi:hypothetical protein